MEFRRIDRLLDNWETSLSISKYVLSNIFSQCICKKKTCSVAFSLLFSIFVILVQRNVHQVLYRGLLFDPGNGLYEVIENDKKLTLQFNTDTLNN